MAELATVARPYAEALFRAVAPPRAAAAAEQLDQLAQIAGDPQVLQFADTPGIDAQKLYQLMLVPTRMPLDDAVRNLLRAVIANGRLSALPTVAHLYRSLVNGREGVSDATVYSAFPIDAAQRSEVVEELERRFGRKLNATVVVEPELIGGIRAVVGDEVLDSSVKARLEQMRTALLA